MTIEKKPANGKAKSGKQDKFRFGTPNIKKPAAQKIDSQNESQEILDQEQLNEENRDVERNLLSEKAVSFKTEVPRSNRKSFQQSVKKQVGFRTREIYLEALKVKGKESGGSGEIALDEILTDYFENNPEGRRQLAKARQVLEILND